MAATPGPWEVSANPHPTKACNYVIGPDGHEVAVVFSVAGDTDEDCWQRCCDDARIVAAARDLLLALSWLHDLEQGRHATEYQEQKLLAMGAARAAIRKATGAE